MCSGIYELKILQDITNRSLLPSPYMSRMRWACTVAGLGAMLITVNIVRKVDDLAKEGDIVLATKHMLEFLYRTTHPK
jgi:hypothetical protein